jgi:hypothetical protein
MSVWHTNMSNPRQIRGRKQIRADHRCVQSFHHRGGAWMEEQEEQEHAGHWALCVTERQAGGRFGHTATVSDDGRILVFGGSNEVRPTFAPECD